MNTMNIIDLHCDTLIKLHEQGCGLEDVQGQIDLDALRRGGALVQCFAVYTPTHEQVHKHKITTGPWEYFNTAADIFDREMEKHKELIRPVRCAADINENMDAGRISAMLTLEDGVCIDGRMERVQQLYDRGVRMIALTWNYENSIGFPNSADPELHALGLKPFGFEVVERMGELGMIVDVSHLSEGGFYDVAEAVKGPFAASHSCARALCKHSRNLTDRQLRILGDHGGVCGVNFYSSFLTGTDCTAIDDILRHMEYIADKAGIEAVALGSDFDGIDCALELRDCAGLPSLAEAMESVFTDDEIDLISSKNALRVLRDTVG